MKQRYSQWAAAALCAAIVTGMMPMAFGAENHVVSKTGPSSADTTKKKWAVSVGGGKTTAVTSTDDSVYTASGSTLYRLDRDDGSILNEEKLEAEIASSEIAPTVAGGKVFVALSDGRVQAFDADSLKSLWVSEKLGDSITCPIVSANGKVYTGTSSAFVCLTASDDDPSQEKETKSTEWKNKISGSFAGVGAYASDDCVVFGSEQGVLYSVKPDTGEQIDTLETKDGTKNAVASSIVKDDDGLYFTCESGVLFRVELKSDGKFGSKTSYDLGGAAATTPTVVNDRVYVGVSGSTEEATSGASMKVLTYDSASNELKAAYSLDTTGFVQGAPLAAETNDEVRIYYTTNDEKGSLYSFLDTASATSSTVATLYTPDSDKQGKTAGAVASEGGELYYSTVNGSVIALEAKSEDTPDTPTISEVSVDRHVEDTSLADLTVNSQSDGMLYYTITDRDAEKPDVFASEQTKTVEKGMTQIRLTDISDEESTVWVGLKTNGGKTSEVKSADLAAVVKAEITVKPTGAKLTVKHEKTAIDKWSGKSGKYTYRLIAGEKYTLTASKDGYVTYSKTVTAKTSKTSYEISLLSKDCKLEQLSLSSSAQTVKTDFTMEPTFDPSKTSYTATTTRDLDTAYVWLRKSDSTASCHVYGKSGVSEKSMRKNKSLYAQSANGYQRYAFRFVSGRTTAKLTIKVTAADKTERTYEVKVKRADKTPPKLTTVTKGTGRTGANTATVIIHSTEAATGYLKVANPGVVPTEITKGVSFSLKKGNTTLRISKLASTERHLYIVAVDKNGNKSAKLKVVIPAYKSTTKTNKSNTSSGNNRSNWLNRIANSGTNKNSSTGTNSGTTSVTGGKTGTNSTTGTTGTTSTTTGTTGTTSTTTGTTGTTGTTSGVTGGSTTTDSTDNNMQLWNSADGTTVDTGVTDSTLANNTEGAEAVDNGGSGSVPENSVISNGTPAWKILVILVVVCGVGFAVYWFIIRRKHPDA